jgi:hypothetical protein
MTTRISFRLAGALGFWMISMALGLLMLLRYENTPSQEGDAPKLWPVESVIPRQTGAPALLMFVHPECPCTRASLGELRGVMEQTEARKRVFVLVLADPALPRKAQETDMWRTAAAIPGVTVLADEDGEEARRFRSSTSGRIVYYGGDGRLLFAGGITASRGHAGDNAGRKSLAALLAGSAPMSAVTPVFGCPLFDRCTSAAARP